jgi:chemotaxis signal transduction protein
MQNSRVIQELKKLDASTTQGSNSDFAPSEFATDRLAPEKSRTDRVVTFRLGGEHFAIRMSAIKEVSKSTHSARMGGFPAWMHLVTSFRGKFIPVVNLRQLFRLEEPKAKTDLQEKESQQSGEQIILEENGSLFCIQVDGLGEVILLSQLRKGEGIASMSQVEKHISQFIESVHKHGDSLVCLVNTKALESYCTTRKQEGIHSLDRVA